jgi:uncharacterized paraquat-inducible protein A
MYNEPVADASLPACPDCELLQRLPDLEPGASARCRRCDHELWRRREPGCGERDAGANGH